MYMYLDIFQAVNVVCWSPCGKYLASGAVDGTVVLWHITRSRNAYKRCTNESGMGITSMEWDPRGRGSELGEQLLLPTLRVMLGRLIMSILLRLHQPIRSQMRLLAPPPMSLMMTLWLTIAS